MRVSVCVCGSMIWDSFDGIFIRLEPRKALEIDANSVHVDADNRGVSFAIFVRYRVSIATTFICDCRAFCKIVKVSVSAFLMAVENASKLFSLAINFV